MPFTVSIFTALTTDKRHCMHRSMLCHSLYRFSPNSRQIKDIACIEACYAVHCIDFHWTRNRSTTLHGSLLCHSLHRFSPNSREINDVACIEACYAIHCIDFYWTQDIGWKSAMPFTVSIFTELTTDQRHCMHRSMLCHSLYRFSLNSRQIYDIAWRSVMPVTV
jgi:hypothetical protein